MVAYSKDEKDQESRKHHGNLFSSERECPNQRRIEREREREREYKAWKESQLHNDGRVALAQNQGKKSRNNCFICNLITVFKSNIFVYSNY